MKLFCKNYFINIVQSLGINPGTREMDKRSKKNLPYIVIYTDERENLEKDGRKVGVLDNKDGSKSIRYKKYSVEVYFAVFIKGRSEDQVEDLKKKFLLSLDEYIKDEEENGIRIIPEVVIPETDDSITRQDENSLEIIIRCESGIYEDEVIGMVKSVEPIPEIGEEL